MLLRRIAQLTLAVAVAAVPLVAVAAPAAAAPSAGYVRAITYSGGGQYSAQADQAARIWNSRVPNIRMSRASGSGNIRIHVVSGGGSRATIGHGSGTIYLDVQQINQGYSALRVVTHEMGHTLGLRDNYNGNCAILMSGGSAGTSCTNSNPSTAEANWVNQSFANGLAEVPVGRDTAVEWSAECYPGPDREHVHA
ncbi:snapalysin family zinc-dependent metalloprotease [Longispora sp. NPDC051575]|uniref:snapalysin family zinc-dependent metalloprotease n=1 Tax=Longispora sp. NPDC051575 TaxID=3154943 RepID=UPI00342464C4